jgi:tripeptidyl-peptidase-1
MRIFAILVALSGICIAAPSPRSEHVVHERRAAEPIDWVRSRRLDGNKVLPIRFGLSQQNMDKLEDMVMAISHPESPTYGQHWSPVKVVETFAPSDDTIEAVTKWLVDSGISRDRLRLTLNKGWIEVNATVAETENLLKTEYHVYSHPSGDEQLGLSSNAGIFISPYIR